MSGNYDITLTEVRQYTDSELGLRIDISGAERKESYRADCVYWMCMMEKNRRDGEQTPEFMELKCIRNLFNEEQEYAFRLGNRYRMFEVGPVLLVFNEKLRPYLFTASENDKWCIWKYFSL